jgi:hypothetical protein
MKSKLKLALGFMLFAPLLAFLMPFYVVGVVTAAVVDAFENGYSNCEYHVNAVAEWCKR